MSRFLLDINVLIALIDQTHLQHDSAHRWFEDKGCLAWASCPLTQLGVLRIVGDQSYRNSPGRPSVVAESLRSLCSAPEHEFWADNIDVLQDDAIEAHKILRSAQVTDTYLLALAVRHKGMLATFDRRLVANAVPDGTRHLYIIR